MQISDVKEGEALEVDCLIKEASARTTKKGSQYLALTFGDQSGTISGNLWDATADQVAQFTAGKVVHLSGQKGSYQGQPQVDIRQLSLSDRPATDFVPRAPESEDQIKAELRPYFAAITNPVWHQLIVYLIKQHGEAFFTSPAAKSNHHAFAGGLSYHTLSILRLAEQVATLYPAIDRQLLYAGTILHDLGKTIELSGAVATEYTVAGKLVGHISLIDGELTAACRALQLDPAREEVVVLRHLVLAHHGLLEYGSPVRPQILEAQVLHQLDELDANLLTMTAALKDTAPGDFTPRLFALDNRAFYRPTFEQKPGD